MPSTNSNASAHPPPLTPRTGKRLRSCWLRRVRQTALACALGALCLLPGCLTVPLTQQDRLLKTYPEQARAAAKAGPDFVLDALETINRLEANQKTP